MINVYISEGCGYCEDLITKLKKNDLEFTKINVDNVKNKTMVENLFKLVGEPVTPIIIIGKQVLAPKKSFNTIDQAISLIQKITYL